MARPKTIDGYERVYPSGHEPPKAGALISSLLQAEELTPEEAKRIEAYLVGVMALYREHLGTTSTTSADALPQKAVSPDVGSDE